MQNLLKRIHPGRYDPVSYWNSRDNPNNATGTESDRVAFDTNYIRRAVAGSDPVLEVGPGVGRTFAAYPAGGRITALDLSREYEARLRSVARDREIELDLQFLDEPLQAFPFANRAFPVVVASQVLQHVPPESIRHTMSELIRVGERVVVITMSTHGEPVRKFRVNHVFNHDYVGLATESGCALDDVIANEGRILFTMRRLDATT